MCMEQGRGAQTVKLHPGPRNVMLVIYKNNSVHLSLCTPTLHSGARITDHMTQHAVIITVTFVWGGTGIRALIWDRSSFSHCGRISGHSVKEWKVSVVRLQ